MNLSDPDDVLYDEKVCSLCGTEDCPEPQTPRRVYPPPDPYGGDYRPSVHWPGVSTDNGRALPTTAGARKKIPLYSGLLKYFPDALIAVAECSQRGNDQHHAGTPIHWDRSKSGDELDALARHLFEAGTFDHDGIRHSTKVAWRALANLQKELESGGARSLPDSDSEP